MGKLDKLLGVIDSISEWTGKTVSFLIFLLALIIGYDVVARYIFQSPTIWAHEVSIMCFGTFVIIGGAYTALKNGHVSMDLVHNALSAEMADEYNMKKQWRVVGSAAVGVDPKYMGIGPVYAIRKLLKQTGLSLNDIELFEINEAFAAPSVAVERELGLNRDIVNVNGSGIALGHPIGNTGCRLVVSLIHEMEKRDLNLGMASLCGGSGHGQAIIVERVS